MKTNFEMIRDLEKEYTPEERGICTEQEVKLIKETLCIREMSVLQLRNLRDFVVLFYGRECEDSKKTFVNFDKMSAITYIIDNELFNKGAEV